MFTGIVQGTAKLVSIDEKPFFARMWWSYLTTCWTVWKPVLPWRITVAA